MTDPTAFLNSPSAYHPPATPLTRTEDTRAPYGPRATGRLSIHHDGSVLIDAKSARLLPGNDNTIDLRGPVREGANWHLDCRAGGLCLRRPNGASGGVRFRAKERVRGLLGCVTGPVAFAFEHVGNDLFRLYPLRGDT